MTVAPLLAVLSVIWGVRSLYSSLGWDINLFILSVCIQSCSFLRFLRLGSCLSLAGSVPASPAAVGLSVPEDGEGGGLWASVAWRLAAGKAFLPSALFLFFGISSSSLCTPCAQCCKTHKGSLRLLLVSHPLRIKFPIWLQSSPALLLQRHVTSYSITNFYFKKQNKDMNFREGLLCQRPLKLLLRLSIAWWVWLCSELSGRQEDHRQAETKLFLGTSFQSSLGCSDSPWCLRQGLVSVHFIIFHLLISFFQEISVQSMVFNMNSG